MASRPKQPTPRQAPRLYLITPPVADASAVTEQLASAMDAGDIAAVLLRLAEADERGAGLEEKAPFADALLDVGAAVRDARVLDRLGDVVVVVDRRADDLAGVRDRREQLHFREILSLRPGRGFSALFCFEMTCQF